MVLNLLSTRSLNDCAVFLDRSFLRFQALSGVGDAVKAAERLERKAEALMLQSQEDSDDYAVFASHEALRVRRPAACLPPPGPRGAVVVLVPSGPVPASPGYAGLSRWAPRLHASKGGLKHAARTHMSRSVTV